MPETPAPSETVQRLYEGPFKQSFSKEPRKKWLDEYVQIVEETRKAAPDELAAAGFQRRLWEDSPITGSGMSTVPMADVINSGELAAWIAALRDRPLPPPGAERVKELALIYQELVERVKPLTTRIPWLKVARLLAALFPNDVTCVVDQPKLRQVAKYLLGTVPRGSSDIIGMNALVLGRLREVLGPPSNGTESAVKRSMFAWELYTTIREAEDEGNSEAGEVEGERPGESSLQFLPVDRRLKGLTAISGYMSTALKLLDFVRNGATIEETKSFIRTESPGLKESSVDMQLSVVRHSLGLMRLNGNVLEPSALGLDLLETEKPATLIPRLLTRIIGFDLVLFLLREESPRSRRSLIDALKEHYPRWTTDFMPSSLIQWALSAGMIESAGNQNFRLTEEGAEWANQIKERPSCVVSGTEGVAEGADVTQVTSPTGEFTAPSFADIVAYFKELRYVFPEPLLAKLHAALHAHPTKHFVLLSGLSGTGKTKIAELYASAYHRIPAEKPNPYFCLVQVQPEWTDPTGLLGYVNPLHETVTYMGTPFLSFLQSRAAHPHIPHIACFDEMNLARVEYYFASFLSSMETASPIQIHSHEAAIEGVEPAIKWPHNLYIIGTVNMDETTHAFSDKVLDRAFTLEFWEVDLHEFQRRFADAHSEFPADLLAEAMSVLRDIAALLAPVHQHFGYRTVEDVLGFAGMCHRAAGDALSRGESLDQAVMMKVLPKLRGQDSVAFRECLQKLGEFLTQQGYTQSAAKVAALRSDLELLGTCRFWR